MESCRHPLCVRGSQWFWVIEAFCMLELFCQAVFLHMWSRNLPNESANRESLGDRKLETRTWWTWANLVQDWWELATPVAAMVQSISMRLWKVSEDWVRFCFLFPNGFCIAPALAWICHVYRKKDINTRFFHICVFFAATGSCRRERVAKEKESRKKIW